MTSSRKNKEIAVTVIGAGLAGTEAVFQLIRRQIPVRLIEMRPKVNTGAHTTDQFAELVCSNSVGSNLPDRASGLLKEEMRLLKSPTNTGCRPAMPWPLTVVPSPAK